MDFPDYYNKLYVQVSDATHKVSGSGICIDGYHIITCAHVVNAAAGLEEENLNKPEGQVQLSFRLNEDLVGNYFPATVVAWGWIGLDPNLPGYNTSIIKNDFAVLSVIIPEEERKSLKRAAGKLKLITGSLSNFSFKAFTYNPGHPELPDGVTGNFGVSDLETGTTIMNKDSNPHPFFFDFGSSGSPILAKIKIENESMTGIAGYADYVNKEVNKVDARMINFRNIEKQLVRLLPQLPIEFTDLSKIKNGILERKINEVIRSERSPFGNDHLCDRYEQVQKIRQIKKKCGPESSNIFYIWKPATEARLVYPQIPFRIHIMPRSL